MRYGWGAFIAYTGLASAPRPYRDMGDWIAAHVATIPMEVPHNVLTERLLQIRPWVRVHRRKLTISIVGLVGRPFMQLITNDRDFDGNPVLTHDLQVFPRKPKEPEVRAAGDLPAVRNTELRELRTMLKANDPYTSARDRMAKINAECADRSEFRTISRACLTGFLTLGGEAEYGPHRISGSKPYIPDFVRRQLNSSDITAFVLKTDEAGNTLPPIWKGSTARSTGDSVTVLNAFGNVQDFRKTEEGDLT